LGPPNIEYLVICVNAVFYPITLTNKSLVLQIFREQNMKIINPLRKNLLNDLVLIFSPLAETNQGIICKQLLSGIKPIREQT